MFINLVFFLSSNLSAAPIYYNPDKYPLLTKRTYTESAPEKSGTGFRTSIKCEIHETKVVISKYILSMFPDGGSSISTEVRNIKFSLNAPQVYQALTSDDAVLIKQKIKKPYAYTSSPQVSYAMLSYDDQGLLQPWIHISGIVTNDGGTESYNAWIDSPIAEQMMATADSICD